MKKFTLSLLALCLSIFFASAKEKGSMTYSPNPIDPTASVTIHYDGTGTNFDKWQPECFIHAWLVMGEGAVGNYATEWSTVAGDLSVVPAQQHMTYDGTPGLYSITISNLVDFFGVNEPDISLIKQLGVIVRTQYPGDNNQTEDFLLSVGEVAVPEEKFNLAYGMDGVEGAVWEFPMFTQHPENANMLYVTVKLPANFNELSYYVGWNQAGFGQPGWVGEPDGHSVTALMNTIQTVVEGDVLFTIDKTSTSPNWGIVGAPVISGLKTTENNAKVAVSNGTIQAQIDGIAQVELFTTTGQLIDHAQVNGFYSNTPEAGIYLLRINGEVYKIAVR